jgi:Spherulation-specific family 4
LTGGIELLITDSPVALGDGVARTGRDVYSCGWLTQAVGEEVSMSRVVSSLSRHSPWAFMVSAGVLSLAGCGNGDVAAGDDEAVDERSSELMSSIQRLTVPAYFTGDDDASWEPIMNAGGDAIWRVIVTGPASGPPPPAPDLDQSMVDRIIQLHAVGIKSFGYVDFYFGKPSDVIATEADTWISDYAADGIFFDRAARLPDQDDVAKCEYFTRYVSRSGPRRRRAARKSVIFNWGTVGQNMERYVNCVVDTQNGQRGGRAYFVTADMAHDVYLLPSTDSLFADNSWLNLYPATQFINLPYKNPDPSTWSTFDVDAIMAKSILRNAASIYVHDFTGANLWGGIDSSDTWATDVSTVEDQGAVTFPGSDTPPPGADCPDPTP